MATWNAIITASSDDARQAGTTVTLTDTGILLNAGTQWAGLRFLSCPIAPGSGIVSALLTLDINTTTNDSPGGMGIYGEAYNFPNTFSTTGNDISNRNRTTNVVPWTGTDIGAGDKTAPDLAAVLNEIINGGYGFSAGNPVALILDPTSTTDLLFRAYDGSTTTCARLTVEYTPPTTAAAGPLVNAQRLKSKLRGFV